MTRVSRAIIDAELQLLRLLRASQPTALAEQTYAMASAEAFDELMSSMSHQHVRLVIDELERAKLRGVWQPGMCPMGQGGGWCLPFAAESLAISAHGQGSTFHHAGLTRLWRYRRPLRSCICSETWLLACSSSSGSSARSAVTRCRSSHGRRATTGGTSTRSRTVRCVMARSSSRLAGTTA